MSFPDDIDLSPDGRHLYVTSDRAIAILRRNPRTGALSQSPGAAGCVAVDGEEGCSSARPMAKAVLPEGKRFAISRDGRFAYLLTETGTEDAATDSSEMAVLVFRRDATGGGLTQLLGKRGCVTRLRHVECLRSPRLGSAGTVAVSADGRNLYVVSALVHPAITVFARNPATGVVRELRGRNGCLDSRRQSGCTRLHGVTSLWEIALTRDGRNAYALDGDAGIAAFSIRPKSGGLRQLSGKRGCIGSPELVGFEGPCRFARGLWFAEGLVLSPDGRSVYAHGGSARAIVVAGREPRTGEVAQLRGRPGCVTSLRSASDREDAQVKNCRRGRLLTGRMELAVDPLGHSVYAVAPSFRALLSFRRRTRP